MYPTACRASVYQQSSGSLAHSSLFFPRLLVRFMNACPVGSMTCSVELARLSHTHTQTQLHAQPWDTSETPVPSHTAA